MSELWPALWLSVRIAAAATVLALTVGVPLAWWVGREKRGRGRGVARRLVDGLALMPLVLPPTVVGYVMVVVLGSRGWIGRWVADVFGYTVMFRFEGAVIAAAVVAVPLVYMPAKAGFAGVDRDLEDTARLSGAAGVRLFWWVSLPLARRAIASGAVLAFARALGEFGATVMVLGLQPGRSTLPLLVWGHYEVGELEKGLPAVVALGVIAFGLVVAYECWSDR